MKYEELQKINNTMRNKVYLQKRYKKHVKINDIKDDVVYGTLFEQHQKNKINVEKSDNLQWQLKDFLEKIEFNEFYVNNFSVLKTVL